MSVVFDRPYEFVPRHQGNWWPWMIRNLRLVDFYLARHDGVVSLTTRHIQRLVDSTKAGHGIVVAPNHCRYADPLAMVAPVRDSKINFYAMASWHLFTKSKFDHFALRKCGAFSLNREGTDRKSLNTAIEVLSTAERPLIMFAEGMTFRTNDRLRPLLEGMSFVGRSAAKKRAKLVDGGKVVIHPVGIKYLCKNDPTQWINKQLDDLEKHLCFRRLKKENCAAQRTIRIGDTLLSLSEIEYLGAVQGGDPQERRERLALHLLERAESDMELTPSDDGDVGDRARSIRNQVSIRYFDDQIDQQSRQMLRDSSMCADLAQDYVSYPNDYLLSDVTDTRIVETIQRLQERVYGKARRDIDLDCVIDIGEPIEVPATRAPRNEPDPLLSELQNRLSGMLEKLAGEARKWPIAQQ